jgi:methylmalonyl-CoA mutase
MPEPSIHDILRESFLKTNKEDWFRAASKELGGKDALENLSWRVDELVFSPYYDGSDLKNTSSPERFRNVSRSPRNLYPGSWENLPRIAVRASKEANQQALQYLTLGADGILFDLTEAADVAINDLLQDIDWRYCNISFTDGKTKVLTEILSYAAKKNIEPSALRGTLFRKNFATATDVNESISVELKHFHTLGIISSSSTPIEEISSCLEQGVLLMDKVPDMGIDRKRAFESISLSITCDDNFFVTIAKLKALRTLWYQLSQAYEISAYVPGDLYIHVFSKNWVSEKFQPHGNMIKNTVHAVAAVLGGCNALTLPPENEDDNMMRRIAANVSNICKEESHLDKVADTIAGSYLLECMAHDFAEAAWKHFQNKCT